MPTKPMARCPACKRRHPGSGRCAQCRGSATRRGYGAEWRRLARAVVDDWVATHGDWCPGYEVPGHASTDLTADHLVPLARGGTRTPDVDQVTVLCRACNARRRDRG